MATGLVERRPSARWLHVRNGELLDRSTGEILNWVSGIITGVRAVPNDRYGTIELHIRINDPEDGPEGSEYIISGGLTNQNRTTQLWARMVLSRLANPENGLRPEELLTIRFYPWKTDYGTSTCSCIQREGADGALVGSKIRNDDFRTVQACLQELERSYPWGLRSLDAPEPAQTPGRVSRRPDHREGLKESLNALYGRESPTSRGSRGIGDSLPF